MARKKWIVNHFNKDDAKELASECNINTLAALILGGRGYVDPFEIDEFFGENSVISDPFLIPQMDLAVERIKKALHSGERIAVCGDYDADGVTSSALIYSYLVDKNCDVICSIPERLEEGYGLHNSTIDYLKSQNVKLIITVDNGIGSFDEIEYAKSLDIDVVVTDHHLPGEKIPQAVAVVDPHCGMPDGEFFDYAGVGVAFKLVCALEESDIEDVIFKYGDLVAVGTIADIVPLVGENRILVKNGLDILGFGKRVGLKKLVDKAGLSIENITADNVAFGIAPRLNAAGRMGKSFRAFQLLTTDDDQLADDLSEEICNDNYRRQETEREIAQNVINMCFSDPDLQYADVCVVAGENWHPGVLGIVAARICEKFGKPGIVLSIDGDIAKGSARSIDGFDLFDSLTYCNDLLIGYGGHKLAAGMTLKKENIPTLRKKINEYASKLEEKPFPILKIDCGLTPVGVCENTAKSLLDLGPFGASNPVPMFGLFNMVIRSIQPVGQGKSLRLVLEKNNETVTCMRFSVSLDEFPYVVGDKVDAAFVFYKGTYKGKDSYSAVIREMRFSDTDDSEILESNHLFSRFMRNEDLNEAEKSKLKPTREDIAVVFRYIKQQNTFSFDYETLYNRVQRNVEYSKIPVCVEVLKELNIVKTTFNGKNKIISIMPDIQKNDLSASQILQKLS